MSQFLSCINKRRYDTEKKAAEIANKFDNRVYYCAYCDGFHTTKKKEL